MEIVQATFRCCHIHTLSLKLPVWYLPFHNVSQYWVPSALIFRQLISFEKYITLCCNFVLSSTYTCSIEFKRVVLFSLFFKNIGNSDDIITSRDFKRYFMPEPRRILSTFFMLLSLYKSQARNIVLCYWGMLFNILQAKPLTVPLFWGNTRISAITSRKYVCSVSFPGSCLPSVIIRGVRGSTLPVLVVNSDQCWVKDTSLKFPKLIVGCIEFSFKCQFYRPEWAQTRISAGNNC